MKLPGSSPQGRRALFAAFALGLASPTLLAQNTTTFEELNKLIKAPNAVTAIGTNLFGDDVNLYNGALTFTQTDVSLPGNNALPVSVGRRLKTGYSLKGGRQFGKWELDIPHIHGISKSIGGWQSQDQAGTRCSTFGPPPFVTGTDGYSIWAPSEYWQGSHIYVPGTGDQQLLKRDPSNSVAPAVKTGMMAGVGYPVVTTNFWSIGCLPSLANGTGTGLTQGEGFLAVSPDGTTYKFDWLVSLTGDILHKADEAPASMTALSAEKRKKFKEDKKSEPTPAAAPSPTLTTTEIWLMPTEITDRFGNWVRYTYDTVKKGNLKTITSSDGRVISFTYVTDAAGDTPLIKTVSDGTRTWTYSYHTLSGSPANLDSVLLPDNSLWSFANTDSLLERVGLSPATCDIPSNTNTLPLTGSMVHPSGATGQFTLTPTTHGRSAVIRQCAGSGDNNYASPPRYFYTNSLTAKTISGPGLLRCHGISTTAQRTPVGTRNASAAA